MNLKLLSLTLVTIASFATISALIEWPTVDTRNNKVGLIDVEICKFNRESETIICRTSEGEKTEIEDVEVITGSSTGTPPWLQYDNYIGQTIESNGDMPGAGRRKIYLKK